MFVVGVVVVPSQVPAPGDIAAQPVEGGTRFTLITAGGHVGFTAGSDWAVIAVQSRLPVTAAAFEIPDPADKNTPESTNLVISLYQPGDAQADSALKQNRAAHAGWQASTEGQWSLREAESLQGKVTYTVVDAEEPCGDVVCGMRLAWPHLAAHDAGYDLRMRALLKNFLASVAAATGAYTLHDGEMLRRPQG